MATGPAHKPSPPSGQNLQGQEQPCNPLSTPLPGDVGLVAEAQVRLLSKLARHTVDALSAEMAAQKPAAT